MRWAKTRAQVNYDLALSGILNLPFAELDATISDIDLNGDNSYGYGPLIDALAAHAEVQRDLARFDAAAEDMLLRARNL